MARTTGSKNVKSTGDQTISTPAGNVVLTPSAGGQVTVSQGNVEVVSGNITVDSGNVIVTGGRVIVGTTGGTAAADHNVGNLLNPTGNDPATIDQTAYSTTAERQLGGAYFTGGVGIEKDLAVGGFIYGRISTALTATTSTQLLIQQINDDNPYYLAFTPGTGNASLFIDNTGQPGVDNPAGLTYNPANGRLSTDRLQVVANQPAQYDQGTDLDNAALLVKGGAAISENIVVGGEVYSINNFTGSYLESIYSRYLDSDSKTSTLALGAGQVDVFGDLRVRGTNPIGTAPVVTNILYVTMDGDDTNDGRAMDAGRACRTIGGALNSPYYQSGTQIRVAPGHYLEDNPLQLKPYTSIVGSDLRTCGVEPINKTQDLFHMNSGCYLAFMQFLNGRSGLLEGDYAPGFNRGAYATAFPPLEGNDRINLFHSPYVQNCTNQSGPWLRDGTMFVPNQTVQIPAAVGTGTWIANTTTLVVNVSSGTIAVGMSINAGQQNPGFFNARTLLLANKPFLQQQVVARVNALFPGFEYSREKCYRDVGILIENTAYDAAFGGNEKSVESGLAYYDGVVSLIAGQETQTVAAIEYLRDRSKEIVTNTTCTNTYTGYTAQQVINWVLTGGAISTASINTLYGIVTATITNPANSPAVYKSTGPDAAFVSAEILMQANRSFIQENTIKWINATYPGFIYDNDKCYRDVGLIIDAVSQDILLGGNQKSVEAGLSYWNRGYNYVANQLTTTTNAINYARDRSLEVIANTVCTNTYTGVTHNQVINTFFQYGGDYMPQEAVKRNFNIVTTIINNGVSAAPPAYAGGGLFALTGINGSDVKISPTVISVTNTNRVYTVGLSTATIGFGNNSTLYFGNTLVFPKQDFEVEQLSLEYTGNANTWDQRKVDPIGAMGGSLVDGAVISDISPIQSFVYDAYTQVNQGGKGIHITNNGYAQLVSVFTIFCSTAVLVENGGIASITNSNSNFGDQCLVSKGYGPRAFGGTVYNPVNRAYPFSPGAEGLDQFYPNGFWPNKGKVEIFLPDTADRPHISLIMEVKPPDGHLNEQSFPGFLNAQPSTGTLTTSTITLRDIDTTDIAVGNDIYIRDQFGRQYDDNGVWYASTGTVVTDINYNAITFNKALYQASTGTAGDPTNPNYFTLYFCGNSYYTVLSSTVATNPYELNNNILVPPSDPNLYQGPVHNQVNSHIASMVYLNTLTNRVISNTTGSTYMTTSSQVVLPLVTGGGSATAFINTRFANVTNIIGAANITAAKAVVPANSVTKTGTITSGAGSAITLIEENLNFLADEVTAYVHAVQPAVFAGLTQAQKDYIDTKCKRDTKIILQRLIYDLETGGNYNSVMSGLSYWSRAGTYHIVELGEAVVSTDLFPDGATVNFYQRSYISASGYLFEYVGAGTNYGALPQRGILDPVQSKETIPLDGGKVFFTSTDQNGDFRIGRGLVISQATGVLSGRTFVQSLYANMTPFILAIE
jgi:hypothetical protein